MISVITTTRYDDYGGNQLKRIQGFLDTIDEYAKRYDWVGCVWMIHLDNKHRPRVSIDRRVIDVLGNIPA